MSYLIKSCSSKIITWNLTDNLAAKMLRQLSNFRVIGQIVTNFSQLWDFVRFYDISHCLVNKGSVRIEDISAHACQVQSSDVIAQSNIRWFCVWYDNDLRQNMHYRLYSQKMRPIARLHRQSMGCLFVRICVKIDYVIMAPHCSWLWVLKIHTESVHRIAADGAITRIVVWLSW